MDTVRVKICYRPLRICWAIAAGDGDAFRKVVRLNHTLWGGRYNPIVIADRVDEATQILEAFRADVVLSVGPSDAAKAFQNRFPHLINPLFHSELFVARPEGQGRAQLLDVHNALIKLRDTPEWKSIYDQGVHMYRWDADDPLADLFLMQLGAYPDRADTHIDYREILRQFSDAADLSIGRNAAVPADVMKHPGITYFSRHGMTRHYSVRSSWDHPGFYFGDASNLDDLVTYWNLRAADRSLWFVDQNHVARFAQIIPAWSKMTIDRLAMRRDSFPPGVAIWSRRTAQEDHEGYATALRKVFGEGPLTICGVDDGLWNGMNLLAPMMILGEATQLGVLSGDGGKPKLSFALGDKPFCGDAWFYTQHLVASVSFIGGLYGDELHTLDPPYVPELNEFYARTMHFEYNKFRVEPERIGLVVDASDSDAFIYALPVQELFARIFGLAGLTATPSAGGLITRQLIAQLGGLRGAAVFKIPGARRLLKTHGPTDAFTAKGALQLIGSKDPENPDAQFGDYEDLYIEARPRGTKLTPKDVFAYLVEKRVFRIGSELTCPHCRMPSWTALDNLKQNVTCEMCGRSFDATRQLIEGVSHYRRSGVLGAEKNAQGAIPVALTLQQLDSNLSHTLRENMYSTSLDLRPQEGSVIPACEVDFVWLVTGAYPEKTAVILGECKDRGRGGGADGNAGTIDATDIANMKQVADAFPQDRFEVYVLLAKLCPFTEGEIAAAQVLNDRYRKRVIMLTARELEPWHIYDRTVKEFKIDRYASSPADLALTTATMYFAQPSNSEGPPATEGDGKPDGGR